MRTSCNGNICRVTGLLCGEFTGHRWIPLMKASDVELWCFPWSAPWINGWINNREAGESRRHRAHYDFIVMFWHHDNSRCASSIFSSTLTRIEYKVFHGMFCHLNNSQNKHAVANWEYKVITTLINVTTEQIRWKSGSSLPFPVKNCFIKLIYMFTYHSSASKLLWLSIV